jgi:hypothetical protein
LERPKPGEDRRWHPQGLDSRETAGREVPPEVRPHGPARGHTGCPQEGGKLLPGEDGTAQQELQHGPFVVSSVWRTRMRFMENITKSSRRL